MRYESFMRNFGFKEGQTLSYYEDGKRVKGKFKFVRGNESMPWVYLELDNGETVMKHPSDLF